MYRTEQNETPESALVRFVDENGWEWRTVAKVINRSFDTNYSIRELKLLYKKHKLSASEQGNECLVES